MILDTKVTIESTLDELPLHDAPVGKIVIDTEASTLSIEVFKHVENRSEYDKKTIQFNEIGKLEISSIQEFAIQEISDYSLKNDKGFFYIEFFFNTGFSLPQWTLAFKFKSVQIR